MKKKKKQKRRRRSRRDEAEDEEEDEAEEAEAEAEAERCEAASSFCRPPPVLRRFASSRPRSHAALASRLSCASGILLRHRSFSVPFPIESTRKR
jgi:hypothetical protein